MLNSQSREFHKFCEQLIVASVTKLMVSTEIFFAKLFHAKFLENLFREIGTNIFALFLKNHYVATQWYPLNIAIGIGIRVQSCSVQCTL